MSDENNQKEQTITIDGVAYPVSTLSEKAQSLVIMYNDWKGDLIKAEKRFNQLQVAVEGLTNQTVQQVRADNQEKVNAEANSKKADSGGDGDGASTGTPQTAE